MTLSHRYRSDRQSVRQPVHRDLRQTIVLGVSRQYSGDDGNRIQTVYFGRSGHGPVGEYVTRRPTRTRTVRGALNLTVVDPFIGVSLERLVCPSKNRLGLEPTRNVTGAQVSSTREAYVKGDDTFLV